MKEMTCTQGEALGRALGFSGYSRAAHSLANNSESTGVMRVPSLWEAFGDQPSAEVFEEFAKHRKAARKPVKDYHRKTYRFSVRVTEERYNVVKRLIAEDGRFPTVNAWLDWWVYVWLEQQMKKAPAVGAAETYSAED